MPSGAKKRKAAKKKLQKVTNNNGSHSQGVDDQKLHDERSSDGGEVEREENFEGGGVNNNEVGAKEVNLGEESAAEVTVRTDNVAREFKNGDHKSSSSSSSSSSGSSDDDDVVVEKEKLTEAELRNEEQQEVEAPAKDSVVEVADIAVEESIPLEESVKEVVSMPPEATLVTESVPEENLSTSDAVESGLKENVDDVLHVSDGKSKVASVVADFVPEKIEERVIPIVNEGSENTSKPVDITTRDDGGLLPQSSGVKAVEGCGLNDNDKVSETQKYTEEEKPLIAASPVPVRRTSWMNCCGLFEVFSGGSSR